MGTLLRKSLRYVSKNPPPGALSTAQVMFQPHLACRSPWAPGPGHGIGPGSPSRGQRQGPGRLWPPEPEKPGKKPSMSQQTRSCLCVYMYIHGTRSCICGHAYSLSLSILNSPSLPRTRMCADKYRYMYMYVHRHGMCLRMCRCMCFTSV